MEGHEGSESAWTDDLRSWMSKVAKFGELEHINGVDWDLELATLVELLNEEKKPRPAVLFDHFAGYPPGYRVAVNLLSSVNRLALTVGLEPGITALEFIQAWRYKIKEVKPVDPLFVPDGPLFENTLHGSQINLFKFPVPRWHELDGGRYIGTDDLVVTRDPDNGWVNVGTYRIMVHEKDRLGLYISPGKHGRVHRDKYFARQQPFPVAISFGHHPLCFLMASNDVPYGVNEFAYAGGIVGKPLRLVKGPLTGLPLPADSEIAIEGEVLPGDLRPEGPFGEWTGYYASSRRAEPVIRVKAVYTETTLSYAGFPC